MLEVRTVPRVEVSGESYPAPPEKVFMAQVAFWTQMGLFVLVMFGESIFAQLKVPFPPALQTIKDNKFMSLTLVWLVGNMLQANLISTGAFEIHTNDKLIWSSLEERRLPTMEDLIRGFGEVGVKILPPKGVEE